ncbi:MAG TPA: hypothetical protein VF177_20990 [Anaerolineae bacterium]
MSNLNHYDIIIIGSGAGGGTLARALAPTGKEILILERGGFLPREPENWSSQAVAVEKRLSHAAASPFPTRRCPTNRASSSYTTT